MKAIWNSESGQAREREKVFCEIFIHIQKSFQSAVNASVAFEKHDKIVDKIKAD